MTQRVLSYADAIREAHAELLASDSRVFVIGQGLWSPWYAGSSLLNLDRDFGRERLLDSPVSENAVTGAAIGAALAGMRPIVFHPRMDFMLLATDPIINQAANWSYMFGGQAGVPLVIRATINRGGEQGAQHSQAVQALFAHVPGLKVVMPATPSDAKGLLISAVRDGNPILYIDDRWLYAETGPVAEGLYETPIGRAQVMSAGTDLTIVASSYVAAEAMRAVAPLEADAISAEVIDLRSIKPWDAELVCESVERTGRVLVVDGAWPFGGVAAEVAATVAERVWDKLRAPVRRLTLPDAPAPTSAALENAYYIKANDIVRAARALVRREPAPDLEVLLATEGV
jgi:acetoin:2,6-dichlorophenolindophenol oxidoreductase subunit beta